MAIITPVEYIQAAVRGLDGGGTRVNYGSAASIDGFAAKFIGMLVRQHTAPAAVRKLVQKENAGATLGWRVNYLGATGGLRAFLRRSTNTQYSSTGDVLPVDGRWKWLGLYLNTADTDTNRVKVFTRALDGGAPVQHAMTVNNEGAGAAATDAAEDLIFMNSTGAEGAGLDLALCCYITTPPITWTLARFVEWTLNPFNFALGTMKLIAMPGMDGMGKVLDQTGRGNHGVITLDTGKLLADGVGYPGLGHILLPVGAPAGGSQTVVAGVATATATAPGATIAAAPAIIAGAVASASASAPAATLVRTTHPLIDMGSRTYWGRPGLLYPNSNDMPATHRAAIMAAAAQVVKRDASGTPSPTGKYVLLAEGPSLMSQSWYAPQQVGFPAGAPSHAGVFMAQAAADAAVEHTDMVILDGAFAGIGNSRWDSAADTDYTAQLNDILIPAGIDPDQVQVVCFKAVNSNPSVSLPTAGSDYDTQVTQLGNIVRAIKATYPSCRIIYLASRTYGGYDNAGPNPEPYAYEGGFAVKEIVQAQIDQMDNGGTIVDARAGDLDYTGGACPVLAWGPYFWADGLTPRSDGVTWASSDFEADGCHPDVAGETKLADMWLAFLKTERSAATWFLADQFLTGGVASASATAPAASVGPAPLAISAGVASAAATAPGASLSGAPATISAGVATATATAPGAVLISSGPPAAAILLTGITLTEPTLSGVTLTEATLHTVTLDPGP